MNIRVDKKFNDLIPPLAAEERRQLEENIIAAGKAYDAIKVWDGLIVDGHNRYDICRTYKLPFKIEQMKFESRIHAMIWMIDNQAGRRNIEVYCKVSMITLRDDLIGGLVESHGGDRKSDNFKRPNSASCSDKNSGKRSTKIGELAGCGRTTVTKVIKINDAHASGLVSDETIDSLKRGDTSINRVVRDLKDEQTTRKRQEEKKKAVKKIRKVEGLYLGDFRVEGDVIPDNSVDLIFTDPPYDRKAIQLYDGLGAFAARVLRPGGSLVAYVGHIQLPEVLPALGIHLRYWWTCACVHSGPTFARMTEYGIVAKWKPIVWYVKETRGDKKTFIDDAVTGVKEKSHHEWQQAQSEAEYYINKLTVKKDFVVDPFCGGGTTPAACQATGRRWAAFEIYEDNYARAAERLGAE